MTESKHPNVNTHTAEIYLEKRIEQAMKSTYIRKPIAWSLYQTWKWADKHEKERKNEDREC